VARTPPAKALGGRRDYCTLDGEEEEEEEEGIPKELSLSLSLCRSSA
jgi:hypothetical protein